MKDYRLCLWYALDKWHTEGGYIILRKSVHWCIPHVLHMNNSDIITHYVPDTKFKVPARSIFGFDGKILVEDTDEGAPMSKLCMLLGTLILLIWGGVWVAREEYFNVRKRLRQWFS